MYIIQQEAGECKDILQTQYGKLLRTSELCTIVNAGNLKLSKNSPLNGSGGNMCAGDISGSPLVCDGGVLTGVLVDRTKCAHGAVYTFVRIAHSHALGWLRSHESTGPFDHFVLHRNSSISNSIVPTTAITFKTNETDLKDDSNTEEQYAESDEEQYEEHVFMSSTERMPSEKQKSIAPVDSSGGTLTEESRSSSAFSFSLVLSVSAALSLLIIALVVGYALSKWCSKRLCSGGVVLPRNTSS